ALGGCRGLAPLRHAGSALWTGVAKDEHGVGVDVECGIVDTRLDVVDVLEDERSSMVSLQRGGCCTTFDDCSSWCKRAAKYADASLSLDWVRQRPDDRLVMHARLW